MHNEFVIQFISGVILEVTLFLRHSALQLSATNEGGEMRVAMRSILLLQ